MVKKYSEHPLVVHFLKPVIISSLLYPATTLYETRMWFFVIFFPFVVTLDTFSKKYGKAFVIVHTFSCVRYLVHIFEVY